MRNLKKQTAALTALLICGSMLAACGNGGGDTSESVSDTQAAASEATTSREIVTLPPDENAVDPNLPVNLEEGVTEKMYGIRRPGYPLKKTKLFWR